MINRLATALVLALILWTGTTAASATDSVVDLPKEVKFPKGFATFQAPWDAGLRGNCDALLASVAKPLNSHDYLRLRVLGEMYDRGVCVKKDASRAYNQFNAAKKYLNKPWSVHTAYKLWHGDGIAIDQEAARLQFRAFLASLAWAPDEKNDSIVLNTMRGRPIPAPLAQGLAWLHALRTDANAIGSWAAALYLGNAIYADGTKLEQNPEIARQILKNLKAKGLGHDLLGRTLLAEGSSKETAQDALGQFNIAARCHYVPSILTLISLYSGETPFIERSALDAQNWALVARELGVNVDAILDEQRRTFPNWVIQGSESMARSILEGPGCE